LATHSSHKKATRTSRAAGSRPSGQAHVANLVLLEELLAQLPVGILVNDADTLEVLHAKPPLPGLADRDLPLDELLRSRTHEDDQPHLGCELGSRIEEVAATGTPQHLPELRHQPAGDEPRWWSASLHRVDTGRWGLVVVTLALDLTDHVRARRLVADREARRQTLHEAIAAVSGPNLVLSLQHVTDVLRPALAMDVATLRLLDSDGNLHLVAASGLRRVETQRLALEPIRARELEAMVEPTSLSRLAALGLHSVEVRWLEGGDDRIGNLTVARRSKDSLTDAEVALLDVVATQLGNALATSERTPSFLRSRSLELTRLNAVEDEAARPPATKLRPRELAILRLYAGGFGTEQIAELLVLSPHTVRTHVRNARRRLGVSSRREALDLLGAIDAAPII
jgi:DNA-binding CsgD family transcriptional regulator